MRKLIVLSFITLDGVMQAPGGPGEDDSGDGPEIQVHGSGNLIQTLLRNDLVDEFWLKIFPVAVGSGKRLFAEGTMPAGFTLTESRISPGGVVVSSYARGGEIKLGSFELTSSSEQATRS